MSKTIEQQSHSVPGMSCEHCRAAIATAVSDVAGYGVQDGGTA